MNKLELLEDLGTIKPRESSKYKARYGLYKCFCGNEFKAQTAHIKSGHTKSCGCLTKSQKGRSSHRLYKTWSCMISRCYNKNIKPYKFYGERGIKVCDRWLQFDNFIEDMYSTFIEGLTLDRKDNNGNYEPDNCRWVTQKVQCRNQTKIPNHNSSGIVGVYFNGKKWISNICVNNKTIYLGSFDDKEDALIKRDKYIIENKLEHSLSRKTKINNKNQF